MVIINYYVKINLTSISDTNSKDYTAYPSSNTK